MATAVIMPKQGQSVETCIITKWFKVKGDSVSTGDILFSYETDKAAFDLESPGDGVLLDIFYPEGSEVPVLSNVAVIGKSGEDSASFGQAPSAAPAPVAAPVAAATTLNIVEPEASVSVADDDSRIRISPRAKRLATDKGVNYRNLAGSGPNGRIITLLRVVQPSPMHLNPQEPDMPSSRSAM
jgi:pyruvate dehydrogenase E2 component (dihydrolipoamide acetyltransferase)